MAPVFTSVLAHHSLLALRSEMAGQLNPTFPGVVGCARDALLRKNEMQQAHQKSGRWKNLSLGALLLSPARKGVSVGPAEVFSAGLAQSMKAFHAEPIKRDLDKNQSLSCPGNPCLESVIHWLNGVCCWWGEEGEGRDKGKGRGSCMNVSHQSPVRKKEQGCDLMLPAKRNQQERF